MRPKTFTIAASVLDPLTAERLEGMLKEAGLDAFSRAGGAASSAAFAIGPPAYDIFVPSESLSHAETLIRAELEQVEKNSELNALAAEEEALSEENPIGDR